MWTMNSPNLGEPCAGIVALVRHAPLGDGEPGATTVIALRRVMVYADTNFLAKDLCRMSLAEGKMLTGSPIALPPARDATTAQFDYTDTGNDVFVSIPVWTRLGCPDICFFYKHQHECLRGTPRTPSMFHSRPCRIHTSFQVPRLHGDPRYGASCDCFLTLQPQR
jgi:hypothetical protein